MAFAAFVKKFLFYQYISFILAVIKYFNALRNMRDSMCSLFKEFRYDFKLALFIKASEISSDTQTHIHTYYVSRYRFPCIILSPFKLLCLPCAW